MEFAKSPPPAMNPTRNETLRTLAAQGLSPEALAHAFGLAPAHVEKLLAPPQPRKPSGLTRVYRFIVSYMTAHHGMAPTIREIQAGADISSTSMVTYYLRKLADQEKIVYVEEGLARNFYLPGSTWTPPSP